LCQQIRPKKTLAETPNLQPRLRVNRAVLETAQIIAYSKGIRISWVLSFDFVVKTVGLQIFTWHCLRQTLATRLVMAGMDIRTGQELMGHKYIGMTVCYSHLAPKHTLAGVVRLGPPTEQPTDTTTGTQY
jgi:integrase